MQKHLQGFDKKDVGRLQIPINTVSETGCCHADPDRMGGRCDGDKVWSWQASQSLETNRNWHGESDALEFDEGGRFLWYRFTGRDPIGKIVDYYWKPGYWTVVILEPKDRFQLLTR